MRLLDIWYLSLALALLSIAAMLVLVLRRVVQTRIDRRREKLRDAASKAILEYLDGTAEAPAVLLAAGGRPEIVADLLFDMREIMRGDGAERLAQLAIATGGLNGERRRLKSNNPGIRAEAVRRITIYGAEAVPALEAALADGDPLVRTAAAIEMSSLGATPALATLAQYMRVGVDATSDDLRRIFRRAVAAEPRAAVAILIDGAITDELRELVIDGLGQAGDYQAMPMIEAMTRHANPEVRTEALRALAALSHPASGPTVVAALADPDWRVRAQAANAARRTGTTEAVPALVALLEDDQWWVRFRAAEALSALGEVGRRELAAAAARGDRAGEVAFLVRSEQGLA